MNCFLIGHPSSTVESSDVSEVERPRNYYKCFASREIETEIVQVCRLLGYYGDIQLLVDHFLELFAKSSVYCKQAAFCVNEIVTGTVRPPVTTMVLQHTELKNCSSHNSADMHCIVRLYFCKN